MARSQEKMVARGRATNRASVIVVLCFIGVTIFAVRLLVDMIGIVPSQDFALLLLNAPEVLTSAPQVCDVAKSTAATGNTTITTSSSGGRATRVLVGIFSGGILGRVNKEIPVVRRQKHRQYFKLIDDPRICTLAQFVYGLPVTNATKQDMKHATSHTDSCQFIYTFVVGLPSKTNANAPTELLSDTHPIHNVTLYHERLAQNSEDVDLTFLNIRENMNEGKSQTWFKYASQVMDQFDFDYVVKADTDSLIVMDKFFNFVRDNLPPGGTRIYAGSLADKAFWGGSRYGVDGPATMKYMRRHQLREVYMEGQLYVLSKDLAHWVSSKPFASESWFEQIEDHDVGMRIFDHEKPIHAIRVFEHQRFWVHPAKIHKTWKLFMDRELRKKSGQNLTQEADAAVGKYFKRLIRVVETP